MARLGLVCVVLGLLAGPARAELKVDGVQIVYGLHWPERKSDVPLHVKEP